MELKNNNKKKWAYVIGIGMGLMPIHNRWLTDLVTSDGVVGFFIPAFGISIWLIGVLVFITWNFERIEWADKKIWIPLLFIVVAIGVTGIATNENITDKGSPFVMGISLFGMYLAGRYLGKDMFIPLAIGCVIASLGIIIHGIFYPVEPSGGFVFERNYDVATGYILLGLVLFVNRWQWALSILAISALFLSGSPEAVFAVCIVAVTVLLRLDVSKRLVYCFGIMGVLVVLSFSLGHGQKLYSFTYGVVTNVSASELPHRNPAGTESVKGDTVLERRWYKITEAIENIKPFGEGYNMTNFSAVSMVHNVPLILVQQLGYGGILAAIAWLVVSIYCLVKTKWKYAWVTILALSVWDHYLWTQLAPVWWAVVGVSLSSTLKDDYVFKVSKTGQA